jgi:Ankyrin repeats (3 copies)
VTTGDLVAIRELVEVEGIDVNEKGASDRTALHRAAGANHVEIISYLLKNNATIDSKDRYQRTPLFWAAIGTHRMIKSLFSFFSFGSGFSFCEPYVQFTGPCHHRFSSAPLLVCSWSPLPDVSEMRFSSHVDMLTRHLAIPTDSCL